MAPVFTTPSKDVIRSGDLIWVAYRKTPWPARAKNVYPKKISYHFFPVTKRPQTFSSDPKVISLFKENDKMPEQCPQHLKEELKIAFKEAKQVLRGEIVEPAADLLTEPEMKMKNVVKQKNSHVSTSSSASLSNKKKGLKAVEKVKSTKDSGIKATDKAEAKPEKKKENEKRTEQEKPEEPDNAIESIFKATAQSDFKEGDVVIVRTELGMWPAKFVSLNGSIVICQLFPLDDNADLMQSLLESVHAFPGGSLDKFISDTKDDSPNLANAFKSVKSYLQTQAKEQKRKEKANVQKKISKKEVKDEKHKEDGEIKSRKRQRVEETKKVSTSDEKKKSSAEVLSGNLRESPRKKKKAEDATTSKKAITFCERITSNEAQEFIKEIFANHSNYKLPENTDLYFDFRNGRLLSLEETEKVISEILEQYSLCTKLPAMQHLCKMHYISTIVFPNLCIFGLSKVSAFTAYRRLLYSCSLEEAKQKYESLLISEIAQLKKPQPRNGSEDGSAFDNLVMAAVQLKGAEEKKKNGVKSSKTNGAINGVDSEQH